MPFISTGPINVAKRIPGLGFLFDIIEFIAKLFGFGSDPIPAIKNAVNNTWANLLIGTAFLYNQFHFLETFIVGLIKAIVGGLAHIISDILHGHLLTALQDIQKLFHALHDIFAPILQFIDHLRQLYYKYIFKWVVFVQDTLSRIRVILSLFRILGQKWAAQLDADIAKIQGYLSTALIDVVKVLNTITSVIGVMVDPAQVLRKDFFSGTLFSSLKGLRAAVGYGADRTLTPSETASEDGDRALITGGAAVLTRNADGSISYSPAMQRINLGFDNALNYYGWQSTKH